MELSSSSNKTQEYSEQELSDMLINLVAESNVEQCLDLVSMLHGVFQKRFTCKHELNGKFVDYDWNVIEQMSKLVVSWDVEKLEKVFCEPKLKEWKFELTKEQHAERLYQFGFRFFLQSNDLPSSRESDQKSLAAFRLACLDLSTRLLAQAADNGHADALKLLGQIIYEHANRRRYYPEHVLPVTIIDKFKAITQKTESQFKETVKEDKSQSEASILKPATEQEDKTQSCESIPVDDVLGHERS